MSKVFYPEKSVFVDASPPHPPNTQYKISFGSEDWGGNFVRVVKIQMVYNGKIEGRKSPSFPAEKNDLEKVMKAIDEIKNQ